jgi:tRNA(His) 5'-end guanylyltransferase
MRQREHTEFITKTQYWQLLPREIITVYSENPKQFINIFCEQNTQIFYVTECGININHYVLKI